MGTQTQADLCMCQQPNNGQKDRTTPFEGTVKVANRSKDVCLYAQRTEESELAHAAYHISGTRRRTEKRNKWKQARVQNETS